MAMVEVNGTSLHVEDTGVASTGETVVFSHGLLWNTELFAPQIAALRDRYRCVAWDHRGQGRSAADWRHCIDMELLWQDAVALLEKLDIGPVHFCGLSMGGFVAMRMAARRPDLVRSLMLLETSAEEEPRANVPRYRLLTRVTRLLGPRVVASRVAPIMFGKSFLADRARRAERDRYVVVAPTLVVVGDEDVATVPEKSERMVAAIAGARLVRVPRAGHSSSVEEPAAVTAALSSFLLSLRSS
jgi:3-oxoadipate enol-lactonase